MKSCIIIAKSFMNRRNRVYVKIIINFTLAAAHTYMFAPQPAAQTYTVVPNHIVNSDISLIPKTKLMHPPVFMT